MLKAVSAEALRGEIRSGQVELEHLIDKVNGIKGELEEPNAYREVTQLEARLRECDRLKNQAAESIAISQAALAVVDAGVTAARLVDISQTLLQCYERSRKACVDRMRRVQLLQMDERDRSGRDTTAEELVGLQMREQTALDLSLGAVDNNLQVARDLIGRTKSQSAVLSKIRSRTSIIFQNAVAAGSLVDRIKRLHMRQQFILAAVFAFLVFFTLTYIYHFKI